MGDKITSFLLVALFVVSMCFSGCATAAKETGGPFYTKATQVKTGMTQNEVVEIVGAPSNTYRKYTVDGLIETWTYTKENPYWIFTFRDGLLRSMSH
jgi:outer membrane protein assembly factor BamE (lipoprotein component of BamABCDE complex)